MYFMLGSASNALETIIAAVPSLFTLVGTVITQIVGNPVLTFFAAIPIVSVGVHILRKLVGASNTI